MINNILVVDDSATARMYIKRCMDAAGFQEATYYEAKDGYDALEIIKSQELDLVITDINMPHMDGKSLLKRIKTNPRYFDLPVLVVTSADNEANEAELKKLGALDILGKPISPHSVAEALNKLKGEDSEDNLWG